MSIRKRQSRARHTEIHKRSTFIAEYIHVKYRHIYEEANGFYSKLAKKYPLKRKLTTSNEYKVWKSEIKNTDSATTPTTELLHHTTFETASTTNPTTTTPEPCTATAPMDISLNIPLMNQTDVQETRDTLVFQDIYPSLMEEINTEIFNQIVHEIEEEDPDFFDDHDEDMNAFIQDEINISLNYADPIEKELLNY